MDTPTIDLVAEKKEILKRYRTLLKSNAARMEKGDKSVPIKLIDEILIYYFNQE